MTLKKGKLVRGLFATLSFLMAFCMLLTGCGGKGLESGFDASNGDMSPKYYCAYKSDTNKFSINDVSLEFYYGGVFTAYLENERENASNYPMFEIYFMNDEEDKILIRTVEENLISEKYRCTPKENIFGNIIGWKFNHSEILTIPNELFTKESGRISFVIYAEDVNAYKEDVNAYAGKGPKIDLVTGETIRYNIDGDNVILSPNN